MVRIAKSLDVLRKQANERWPDRKKSADGWVGDSAHSSRASDHNPNAAGVVTALDLTHDPSTLNAGKLAETLRESRDPRIKFLISNKRICSGNGGTKPWIWRKYTGANGHTQHVHISVHAEKKLYDSTIPWNLGEEVNQPEPSNTGAAVARTVGIGVGSGTAVTQVISAAVGPVTENVERVQEVVTAGGQVVDVSRQIISVAPTGFWENALAFVQSPKFLAAALAIVCIAWGATYYLRARKVPE